MTVDPKQFRPPITNQSVVNIGRDSLSFNVQTASILHHAAYVRVLLNAKTRQLAVQAASVPDLQTARFFRPEAFKMNRIRISSRAMIKEIRATAGWAETDIRNIAGVYSAEEDAIFYDLTRAGKPSSRGGWSEGRQTRRCK